MCVMTKQQPDQEIRQEIHDLAMQSVLPGLRMAKQLFTEYIDLQIAGIEDGLRRGNPTRVKASEQPAITEQLATTPKGRTKQRKKRTPAELAAWKKHLSDAHKARWNSMSKAKRKRHITALVAGRNAARNGAAAAK